MLCISLCCGLEFGMVLVEGKEAAAFGLVWFQ